MFAPITRAHLHPPQWSPPTRGPRRTAVTLLLRASALLVRTAVRLQQPTSGPPLRLARSGAVAADLPGEDARSREFHAEAGAPEGALYVGGQLVGRLPGVKRL
ncbi:MAG TPA: hypothetical protein VFR90_17630 [Methylibium sp.]|uniref:hypothetical protein n=1 Tax=Methylibium sp. TaxID=2067992 RepID=UPI002DBACB8A|nr:hypothetical protein [Methylibium sp.]HEU4460946.1 hypothetical protein [Methylibium sp.]